MEFCSICTASFDSDDRRIRCSGQRCDLAFHQRCVHLSEDQVRLWMEDDVGMFWFCPTCRLEFAAAVTTSREDGKHKLEENGGGESTVVKRSRMDPSFRLPPEVWTMIFQHLDSRWLARVRLVCRDWNEMVSTRPELMGRFLLQLGTAQLVDDLEEVRHFLALRGGFTRARINLSGIRKDKPWVAWFTGLGVTLSTLSCISIPFGYLYELLRAFPNLKRLTLDDCFEFGKTVKLNYRLAKLEELTIASFNNKNYGDSIWPTLQHICPRLTVLKLGVIRFLKEPIGSFVQSVELTLQELEIGASAELIKVLINMNGLKLKRLTISCSESDLMQFLQRQSSIVHLHFRNCISNVSTLQTISRILPNLNSLTLAKVVLGQTSPSILLDFPRANFIRAQYVDSSGKRSGLNYRQCSNLRQLEISKAYLPGDVLASLQSVVTQITSVKFTSCIFDRSSDIFAFMQQSKMLTTLELDIDQVIAVNDKPDVANGFSSIRHLKFFYESKKLMYALVELCPDLESLDIVHKLLAVDITSLGQRLKRLQSLTLHVYCPDYTMTSECLRSISTGFEALSKLRIIDCVIPKEEVRDALQGLRKDVEVIVDYC